MVLRQGRTGLGEDDFMLVEGSEDDNEKWAGAKVLAMMKSLALLDAVVVVSRWCVWLLNSRIDQLPFVRRLKLIMTARCGDRYGGIMLGPVRFTHIEDCTRQVCDQIIVKDEIDDSIATLTNFDSTLAALRGQLEGLRRGPPAPAPSTDTLSASGDTFPATAAVEATTTEDHNTLGSQHLPPWFQTSHPEVPNPRKRSRSPDHPIESLAGTSNGDDVLLHEAKRPKTTSLSSTSQSLPSKSVPSPVKTQDYSALLKEQDVKKARRLITARENAIKSVKTLITKEKEKSRVHLEGGLSKNGVAPVDGERNQGG